MSGEQQQLQMRAASAMDAAAVAAIYNWYIENSSCTFEQLPLTADEMAARIAEAGSDKPWIVLIRDGELLGYAYATIWKARAAYNRSREVTVYLHRDATGQGYGKRLYQQLIDELAIAPIHTLIASIALPNASSVALHESLGFVKVGQIAEIGYKFDQFVDVGYWQLRL